MKRRGKQKKVTRVGLIHASEGSGNQFDAFRPDGPKTRSSNESAEDTKAYEKLSSPDLSEDRLEKLHNQANKDNENVGPDFSKGLLSPTKSSRGRRPKVPVKESYESLTQDDQSNESRGTETVHVTPNVEQNFGNDDEVAPELVAAHDPTASASSSTFAGPRHLFDKGDVNAMHNQRKINKRELKALLKQTKKNRSVLDQSVLATMDELASRLKDDCIIETNPIPQRRIRIASPPVTNISPTRRGVAGRRAGRRGGRGGRRGGKPLLAPSCSPTSSIPASWVPLILPYTPPKEVNTSGTPNESDADFSRPSCFPWLRQLSEQRVHRFIIGMQQILAQHNLPQPPLSARPILDVAASMEDVKRFYPTPVQTAVQSKSSHSSGPISAVSTDTVNSSNTEPSFTLSDSERKLSPSLLSLHPPYSEPSEDVKDSVPVSSVSVQADSLDTLVKSVPVFTPVRRGRGRGSGRKHHGWRPGPGRGHHTYITPSSGLSVAATTGSTPTRTASVVPKMKSLSGERQKPRVSRELRGLVTWDAVMEQQRRQQEHDGVDLKEDHTVKAQRQNEATLAVANDLLAAAAMEEDTAASRTRRTRQSSGNALSQVHSTFHSETASNVTTTAASDSNGPETGFHAKPGDLSSTAHSGLSTESSSISSDLLANSHLAALETVDEASDVKAPPSTIPPSPVYQKPTSPDNQIANVSVGSPNRGSELCMAKYSPISVDQEPDAEPLTNILPVDVDGSPKKDFGMVNSPQKRVPTRRKHKKNAKNSVYNPLGDAVPASTSTSEKQEPVASGASSNGQLSVTSIPVTPIVTGSNMKRRRQSHSTHTPPQAIMQHLPDTQDAVLSDQSTSLTHEQSGQDGSTSELILSDGSPRRSAAARSSALPPRKRYKVGIDSGSDEVHTATISSASPEVEIVSISPAVTPTAALSTSVVHLGAPIVMDAVSADVTNSIQLPQEPPKKRGRGRPRRYPPKDGLQKPPIQRPVSSGTLVPPDITLGVSSSDRPKREAAAIGFASLVAANLNNNLPLSGTTAPSEALGSVRPQHSLETEHSTTGGVTTKASHTTASVVNAPHPPRGRGRPAKPKPPVIPPTAVATMVLQTNDLEVEHSIPTQSVSHTGRRKRPALVLSPGGKTYKHVYGDTSTALATSVSVSPPAEASPATPVATHGRGRPKLNRDRSEEKVDKTAVVNEPDAVYSTEASSVQEQQPPVTPVKQPGHRGRKPLRVDQGPPITKVPIEAIPSTGNVIQLHPERSTVTAALHSLPERSSLFQGHLLTDVISLGVDPDSPCKGPICDIFLRFLNEPDPSDPSSRLTAPFLYLPNPHRYPEFYRFVISSYSSSAGFRARFTSSFIARLFNSPEDTHSSENYASDESSNFGVEYPSLCLVSIARRFSDKACVTGDAIDSQIEKFGQSVGLNASELSSVGLNPSDVENSLPLLDAAIEGVLSIWESFAGRRSWLGRRLLRLRTLYSTIRSDCIRSIANEYGLIVPPLKATAVLNMPTIRTPGTGAKKKADRRALERGAEVIRCLCGFRVEGGHVMVQCDRCASWQHLPCLWWALNQAVKMNTSSLSDLSKQKSLCQAALTAAQAAGSGYLAEIMGPAMSGKVDGVDLAYFCPVCLGLNDLTLEYPRSLSAAMAMDDLDAVFSLQETTVEGEREFWSLASSDGLHQVRTDDYAFINRNWMACSISPITSPGVKRLDPKHLAIIEEAKAAVEAHPIRRPYDQVVIRIYRLWKDLKGTAWLEGGLFLRPYDLPFAKGSVPDSDQRRLWHYREVIYDEASRLVLPLSAWHSRCVVLCPSAYRTGRPADLLSAEEAEQFLAGSTVEAEPDSDLTIEKLRSRIFYDGVSFVCEKLFERVNPGQEPGTTGLRFDEISPGYLKVNMRPYCFLRKPDVWFGRSTLQRHFTAEKLLEFDQTDRSTPLLQPVGTSTGEVDTSKEEECSSAAAAAVQDKQKGERLARLVDWLERKRQTDVTASLTKAPGGINLPTEQSATAAADPQAAALPATPKSPRSNMRGRRGRGRGHRLASPVLSSLRSPPAQPEGLGFSSSEPNLRSKASPSSIPSSPRSPERKRPRTASDIQISQETQSPDEVHPLGSPTVASEIANGSGPLAAVFSESTAEILPQPVPEPSATEQPSAVEKESSNQRVADTESMVEGPKSIEPVESVGAVADSVSEEHKSQICEEQPSVESQSVTEPVTQSETSISPNTPELYTHPKGPQHSVVGGSSRKRKRSVTQKRIASASVPDWGDEILDTTHTGEKVSPEPSQTVDSHIPVSTSLGPTLPQNPIPDQHSSQADCLLVQAKHTPPVVESSNKSTSDYVPEHFIMNEPDMSEPLAVKPSALSKTSPEHSVEPLVSSEQRVKEIDLVQCCAEISSVVPMKDSLSSDATTPSVNKGPPSLPPPPTSSKMPLTKPAEHDSTHSSPEATQSSPTDSIKTSYDSTGHSLVLCKASSQEALDACSDDHEHTSHPNFSPSSNGTHPKLKEIGALEEDSTSSAVVISDSNSQNESSPQHCCKTQVADSSVNLFCVPESTNSKQQEISQPVETDNKSPSLKLTHEDPGSPKPSTGSAKLAEEPVEKDSKHVLESSGTSFIIDDLTADSDHCKKSSSTDGHPITRVSSSIDGSADHPLASPNSSGLLSAIDSKAEHLISTASPDWKTPLESAESTRPASAGSTAPSSTEGPDPNRSVPLTLESAADLNCTPILDEPGSANQLTPKDCELAHQDLPSSSSLLGCPVNAAIVPYPVVTDVPEPHSVPSNITPSASCSSQKSETNTLSSRERERSNSRQRNHRDSERHRHSDSHHRHSSKTRESSASSRASSDRHSSHHSGHRSHHSRDERHRSSDSHHNSGRSYYHQSSSHRSESHNKDVRREDEEAIYRDRSVSNSSHSSSSHPYRHHPRKEPKSFSHRPRFSIYHPAEDSSHQSQRWVESVHRPNPVISESFSLSNAGSTKKDLTDYKPS
ncbi:unnamed protein product [Calicophoron daubneyi]|uniref:BAH domain-containing protein n=1 Tax=Calicophoron daubneyi TaxID=300641 RepID=A0AAV2TCV0_CALDB